MGCQCSAQCDNNQRERNEEGNRRTAPWLIGKEHTVYAIIAWTIREHYHERWCNNFIARQRTKFTTTKHRYIGTILVQRDGQQGSVNGWIVGTRRWLGITRWWSVFRRRPLHEGLNAICCCLGPISFLTYVPFVRVVRHFVQSHILSLACRRYIGLIGGFFKMLTLTNKQLPAMRPTLTLAWRAICIQRTA